MVVKSRALVGVDTAKLIKSEVGMYRHRMLNENILLKENSHYSYFESQVSTPMNKKDCYHYD